MATGCTNEGTAHHEMMHALGFKHEHVRPDRDDYLDLDLDYLQTYKVSVRKFNFLGNKIKLNHISKNRRKITVLDNRGVELYTCFSCITA